MKGAARGRPRTVVPAAASDASLQIAALRGARLHGVE